MKGADIRKAFLDYFAGKGHQAVSSSSLVPANDPTLLFSNAGMNQFKDCFLGTEQRSYTRAASSQKCLRISGKHNDLENVGVTARHHTFFEMLGNFSFGDYFKREAIEYGWEFITETLGVDKRRLWATVFEDDDEAAALWTEVTDIPAERVVRMGEKDNFWAMGDTGPCGPCSELHYYIGDDLEAQSEELLRLDDGTFLEIWNLVFMQFERSAEGVLTPLPKPSVDTGMGLERIAAVMQGVTANYDSDLLRGIITVCEELTGFKYDGSSYAERDLRADLGYARDVAMRVIADHSRAIAFLIADGVQPGSDGRGYVLRRILRRAVRHGRVLAFKEPFLQKTTKRVIELFGGHFPELLEHADMIGRVVDAEERKFHETLDAGLAVLQREIDKLEGGKLFPGRTAFLLHDTYGFPLDLTEDALKAYGLQVDAAEFDRAMEAQRQRSRDDRRAQDLTFVSISVDSPATEFLGYQTTEAETRLTQILGSENQSCFEAGAEVLLLFTATPFYAEAGGQVGDSGTASIGAARLRVLDAQRLQERYSVHRCVVEEGELNRSQMGAAALLSVDAGRRQKIRLNHSATHLLHSALRRVLGDHVKQAGSRVDERGFRFDYSHFEALSTVQAREIQELINADVRSNFDIVTTEMALEDARAAGAMALFGEKYGSLVRVVQMGPDSLELCGGTHAASTGDIGLVLVAADGGISAGVRRIECLSGGGALDQVLLERQERAEVGRLLKGAASLPERIEKLLLRSRSLEREIEDLKGKLAAAKSSDVVENARLSPQGVRVITEKIEGADTATLRTMVDRLRLKLGSGVVALGSSQGSNAVIVAGVTADLTGSINAGKLVRAAAEFSGGRGGGRADFAQAGGVDPALLGETLDKLFELVA